MKSLILTPEQKAMRAYERRHSAAGQTAAATRRIEHGLEGLSDELVFEGGQLAAPAIINGLLNNLTHHMAQLPDGDREAFVRNFVHALPGRVEARVIALAEGEQ